MPEKKTRKASRDVQAIRKVPYYKGTHYYEAGDLIPFKKGEVLPVDAVVVNPEDHTPEADLEPKPRWDGKEGGGDEEPEREGRGTPTETGFVKAEKNK